MTKLVLVVACALVDGDGRVLLAQRREGGAGSGLWEFPGGKVEDGETPEAALVRELREELDLEVEASCLSPIAFASRDEGAFHLLMPLFVCRKWSGVARPLAAARLAWALPGRLLDYDLVPADAPLAAQLRDFL